MSQQLAAWRGAVQEASGRLPPTASSVMRPAASALIPRSLAGLRSIMTVGKDSSDFYGACYSQAGQLHAFLDGAWRASTSGKTVSIINPSTNQTAYQVQGERPVRAMASLQPVAGAPAHPAPLLGPPQGRNSGRTAQCARRGARRRRALRRLPPRRLHPFDSTLPRVPAPLPAACTQQEVDEAFRSAKKAQKVRLAGRRGRCPAVNSWCLMPECR